MAPYNTEMPPIQRFWLLLKPDGRDIQAVYVYAIFSGLITLSLPLGIQAIINMIQGGEVNAAWVLLVSVVVLGLLISGILQILQLRITENLQQRIFARSAFEFAYRIPRFKMEALYKHYAPELMNRFFDTITLQKGISKILIDFTSASLQVVFGLILLSFYHPFFIIFSVILIVLIFVIFKFTGYRGMVTSLKESKHKYQLAYWLEEVARTNMSFKLAGQSKLPLHRTDVHTKDYLEARENHFKVLVLQYGFLIGFKVLIATGLLAIGGVLVMDQLMNIGQFVAAEIIIILIMASVEKLILSLETIYDVLTSLEKIGQVTDIELENTSGYDFAEHATNLGLQLDIHNLTFEYPHYHKPSINNLTLNIKPGEKVVLAGANGSGKSTLLHLICGFYTKYDGNISYNNLPLGNLNLESLRAQIGDFLSQELLFEETLLNNIAMGREAATFERVQWAIKSLKLEGFVKSLPKGYEEPLDPQGKKLPRSIVQKLLLARCLAANPKLIILEDTFEHILGEEKNQIIDFLTDPKNGWTFIASSTNEYLMKKADRVVVLSEGSLLAEGKYDDVKHLIAL